MTINLKEWIGKNVKVTLRNGLSCNATIQQVTNNMYLYELPNFGFCNNLYTSNGRHYRYYDQSSYEIICIEELTMNTNDILTEINKTKVQLHLLEEKLKQAEEQEKSNSEIYTPIEDNSGYKYCLKFLKTKNVACIGGCFDWDKTPQGSNYWVNISDKVTRPSDDDFQQIKDWVINYLIQKEL